MLDSIQPERPNGLRSSHLLFYPVGSIPMSFRQSAIGLSNGILVLETFRWSRDEISFSSTGWYIRLCNNVVEKHLNEPNPISEYKTQSTHASEIKAEQNLFIMVNFWASQSLQIERAALQASSQDFLRSFVSHSFQTQCPTIRYFAIVQHWLFL